MIVEAISSMLPGLKAADQPGPLDDYWYGPIGQATPAGIDVTIDNAMRVSAVYGCVRLLREALGHLPFLVYERTGEDSREKAFGHYLWRVLHDRPNRWQTPMTWKEMGVSHLILRGNFYCAIIGTGDDMELWPLNPDRMEVKQAADGRLTYAYRREMGDLVEYRQENIYHVVGPTLNGVTGISVIEYARNTIGSTIAQESHGASLFKNGGLPTFWISRPAERKWTDTAQRNFRKGWRRLHGGAENAGNPPILQDDMQLHELKLTNKDSQWMESRGLAAEEICRFFGISPHMIGVKSTSPRGNTEQQALEFLMYTLTPLAARFEQAANVSLIADEKNYYTKFNLDALRRADTKTRHEAHNIAVQGGWKSVNEVRALEELNPVDGGDECRFPMNMQPAGGGPDENEQGGQPGKGQPKPPVQQEDTQADARVAFATLLEDAAARISAAEIKALSSRAHTAADDHAKWCEWAKGVYDKHRAYVKKTRTPICQSWAAINTTSPDPGQIASDLCDPSEIWELFDAETDVPALLALWQTESADTMNKYFRKVFFNV